jgi:hypothetical protein
MDVIKERGSGGPKTERKGKTRKGRDATTRSARKK